jgi:hypothetical protein
MTADVAVAVVVLAAAGALPAVALAGIRPVTVPLMPLAGAALAAAAATGCLLVAGDLEEWFIGLSALAGAAVIGVWAWRPSTRRHLVRREEWSWPVLLGMAVVVVAVVWSLRALTQPDVGYDARMLWVLRGAWFVRGHDVARAVLTNKAYQFSEPSFPPLIGAASGVGWIVNGLALGSGASFRLGQIVVGVLNGCALVVLGGAVLALPGGRGDRAAGAGRVGDAPGIAVRTVATAMAPILCVAAAGAAGEFATNGFADAPWVFAAAFAVVFGLVLPISPAHIGIALVGIAVAGQIKLEGTATAAVVLVLVGLRYALSAPRAPVATGRSGRWRTPVVVTLLGLAGLLVWPLATVVLHAVPDADTTGRRHGTDGQRLHATVSALAGDLHVVPVAAAVAVAGVLALRGARRRLGLGTDLTLWVVMAADLVVVGATYVTGATLIQLWLAVSVGRVVLCAVVLCLVDVSVWAVVAVDALRRPVARPGPSPHPVAGPPAAGPATPGPTRRPERALDADVRGVLHHLS